MATTNEFILHMSRSFIIQTAPLMQSLSSSLAITGAAYVASMIVLAVFTAPLGSPLFFACAGCGGVAYLAMLARVWNEDRAPRRLLLAAFGLALAIRLPLAFAAAGPDNDMVRYRWDGRVQHLGYNPYLVVPSDPALAATHTDETRMMPSRNWRTPYLPSAQLFFRLIVGLHDSSRMMKLALIMCDLVTIVVVWRWLATTGRQEWLALAYAWNPLVVLEISLSGHIDALGMMWIAASAYWLSRRRTALASIAFVLAVTTKLLPIVLLPLYWKRVRVRDAVAGSRGVRSAVSAICRRQHAPARRGAQRARVHPVQRSGVQDDRGGLDAAGRGRHGGASGTARRRVGAMAARSLGSRGLGVADGGRARVRAGRVPVVPAVVHALPLHQRHMAAAGLDLQRDSRLSGLGVLPSRGPLARAGGLDGRGIRSAVADARGEGDPAPRHESVTKNREPDSYSSGNTTQRMT